MKMSILAIVLGCVFSIGTAYGQQPKSVCFSPTEWKNVTDMLVSQNPILSLFIAKQEEAQKAPAQGPGPASNK